MTLLNPSNARTVSGLKPPHDRIIRAFVQGAVYCWVKNRLGEWFAVRDLVGGENANWEDTPLQVIFDKHVTGGKSSADAFKAAAKDIGWIVK